MFKYFLYQVGLFFLNRLSINSSYKFATFLSDMQHRCSVKDRRAVTRNFKRIFPEKEDCSDEVRDVFRNFGRYLVEFFKTDEMVDDAFLKTHVRFDGVEHLNAVLKEGKGGIVVTAHIGNWELGGVLISMMGYPMTVVALPHKERPVNDLFNKRRESKGVIVIPTNTAVRRCIEHLKNNRLVALVADRDFGDSGFEMDFLGESTLIPKGPAMFSWKTGSPIVPVFCLRDGNGKFVLKALKPIYPPKRSGGEQVNDEILKGIMRQYIPILEDHIRAHPSQWLLFRDFNER